MLINATISAATMSIFVTTSSKSNIVFTVLWLYTYMTFRANKHIVRSAIIFGTLCMSKVTRQKFFFALWTLKYCRFFYILFMHLVHRPCSLSNTWSNHLVHTLCRFLYLLPVLSAILHESFLFTHFRRFWIVFILPMSNVIIVNLCN